MGPKWMGNLSQLEKVSIDPVFSSVFTPAPLSPRACHAHFSLYFFQPLNLSILS